MSTQNQANTDTKTNPDLSAVLHTLSTLSQRSSPASTSPHHPQPHPNQHQQHHHDQSQSPSQSQNQPQTDPRKITTWPRALRHIMHLFSTHPHLHQHIRRLISTQHAHERRWWAEREALVQRQAARGERKRELQRVLQSVGAAAAAATTDTEGDAENEQENAVELAYHDAQVYQAASKLSRDTEAELRRLGVPFFAIETRLVADKSPHSDEQISRDEVAALKRRTLDLLQDLCQD